MGTFAQYHGNMVIADDKKQQFNEHMDKILYHGGMMEFNYVKLYGYELPLLKPVRVKENKEVCFHFNYFADSGCETAAYFPESCSLQTNKIGSDEYAEVLIAAYFLYEMYDEDCGLVTVNGEIVNPDPYIRWLNYILKTEYSLKKRFDLWKNMERFSCTYKGYNKCSECQLGDLLPRRLMYAAGGTDLVDFICVTKSSEEFNQENQSSGTYTFDVLQCKNELKRYFERHSGQESEETILQFVQMKKDDRIQLAGGDLEELSRLSMYMPARVFVYLMAEIRNLDFSEIWCRIKERVYHDETMKQYASEHVTARRKQIRETPEKPLKTSAFLIQDQWHTFYRTPKELTYLPKYYTADDDRMYWYDGSDEVVLSDELKQWLKELSSRHKEIMAELEEKQETVRSYELEFLIKMIDDVNEYYGRIFWFEDLFYDFMANRENSAYHAALILYSKLYEEYKDDGKVIEHLHMDWTLTSRIITHNQARIKLKRFVSVMGNSILRRKYFDF